MAIIFAVVATIITPERRHSVPGHDFAIPPAPYEILTANDILALRPANIFCKINQFAEKTTAKSADDHVAPPAGLLCSL